MKLDTLKLKTAEWKGANFSVFADVLYIPFSSNVEKWLCYKRMAHFAYGEEDQFFSSRIKTTVASSKWRLANFVQIHKNSIGDIHNFTEIERGYWSNLTEIERGSWSRLEIPLVAARVKRESPRMKKEHIM